MTLSDRMIEYRARENISQAELAARVGVDRCVINKAEKREAHLTPDGSQNRTCFERGNQ